jgi:hypothetical protein
LRLTNAAAVSKGAVGVVEQGGEALEHVRHLRLHL